MSIDNNYDTNGSGDEQADARIRSILNHWGEPSQTQPPSTLVARVVAALPQQPPAVAEAIGRRRRQQQQLILASFGLLIFACFAVGIWGVFVNSSGPALLVGALVGGLGRIVLVLTLAAKPLTGLLVAAGATQLIVGTLAVVTACWGWWALARPMTTAAEATS